MASCSRPSSATRRKTIGHKIRASARSSRALGGIDGRAARPRATAKADLASHAVGEFPELQGMMGKHYARDRRRADEVADAIEQHWWPKGQGAALPQTDDAALVAIADRMDTIVGCFAVGLEPSGSADPFGLRRAAIGIWQILLDRGWTRHRSRDASDRARRAARAAGRARSKDARPARRVLPARLRGIFVDQGIPPQDADAALAQGFNDPGRCARPCARVREDRRKEAREVFKRVANILDDARGKKLAIGSRARCRELFVRRRRARTSHAAIDERASDEPGRARASATTPPCSSRSSELRPDGRRVLRQGRRHGHGSRCRSFATTGSRCSTGSSTPYMAIADFRLLGGAS